MSHFQETSNSYVNPPFSRNFNHQQQTTTSAHPNSDFKKPKNPLPNMALSSNKPKPYVPYKSQLCALFPWGKCHHGESCHFSHSLSEIRAMRECVYFSRGLICPYGQRCNFLHKCDEKVSMSTGGERYYKKTVVRKTEICRKRERYGRCCYGVKCVYAHGKAELQGQRPLAEMKHGHTSRLMLTTRPHNAASYKAGTTAANKLQTEGKSNFMNWEIEKIGQIYADWIDQ